MEQSISDADLILFVIDARHPKEYKNREFLEFLTTKSTKPVILVLTKIDTIKQSSLIALMQNLHTEFNKVKELIPVSAQENQNVENLTNLLLDNMQPGPLLPSRILYRQIDFLSSGRIYS